MCQWFNALNCRSATRSVFDRQSLRNGWLVAGLVLSVVLQALVLYVPMLAALLLAVALPPATLLALAGLATLVLAVEEGRKAVVRLRLVRR